MNAFDVVLLGLNSAAVLAWIKYQVNIYADVQIIKEKIKNIENKIADLKNHNS